MKVFPDPKPTYLRTTDGGYFPVGRVFCVGRNYEAHAREMGKNPERDPPFFFTKWAETVLDADPSDNLEIRYPPETKNYHHEAELVVAIGAPGFRVTAEDALDLVWGYATGLDMTRRDLQLDAREKGRPWDTGKNVENSCPTGRLRPVSSHGHINKGPIALSVNGETRQSADIADLIWSVPEIIADLSRFYELRAGDLIYTGTPAGVSAVRPGDQITCSIDGLEPLSVSIGAAA